MKYELFHDESKENGYWHGILLVPESTKQTFFENLKNIRNNTQYASPISLKNIKKRNRVFSCAEAWVIFAVGAMMSNLGRHKYPISLGRVKNGALQWEGNYGDIIGFPIGAKFILFRDVDHFQKMPMSLDYGDKVEITFGMGLKGGIHFLGDDDHTVEISKMHFDGWEHYCRSIDRERIVARLQNLRRYFNVLDNSFLIYDGTSNHTKPNCQTYEDCQFLQLTDLLVGSFRVALGFPTTKKGCHDTIAQPVKYIIDKYQKGYARMQNSRWNNSFCMSQCYLHNGQWVFKTLEPRNSKQHQQPELF